MKNLIIATIMILAMLPTVGCASMSNAQKGTGVGALAGGLVGALVSKDKLVGTAIGAGVGAVFGYMAGNEMDKYDQAQLSRVAETVPSGQTSTWENPDTGRRIEATPRPAVRTGDEIFRDVIVEAEDGTRVTLKVKRLPDGTWIPVNTL
jgi:surface antigen